MAKQPEEQNIKSRARRRLIGAVALALAVVVILPMVLDSEPKISGKDIELRIPAPEKAGEFVPGVAVSEVVETVPLMESAVASAVPEVKEIETAPLATGKITLAETKPKAMASVETKPLEAGKTEAVENRPVELKKPEVTEAKKTEVKPTEKKTTDKSAELKSADKPTYIVQVGAFANSNTASTEADKLKAWGFKAYTEQISGTTRVRVGPYTDRKKADDVRQMLEKHGLHPAVTAVNGHGK